jgi:hypothetical protein
MTEIEWVESSDPQPMLEFLRGRASERKLRLFAVACCRRVRHLTADPRICRVVEAAEQLADGLLGEEEFAQAMQPIAALWGALPDAREGGYQLWHYLVAAARHLGSAGGAPFAADFAARALASLAGETDGPEWTVARRAEELAQCSLIRDLFGDPSVPFRFDPDWLSGQGGGPVQRARAIYREGAFDEMETLADLLAQAGCLDPVVLGHCRRRGPHAKGCWVVDALLGHEPAVRAGLLTEADWRACGDPEPLLHFLRDKGSVRKWRLFAVACCRRIDRLIGDERSRRAVEVAARHADGLASDEELAAARTAAQQAEDEADRAEYDAEAEADFQQTPTHAAASRRLYAAAAAREAVRIDPRISDDGQEDAEDRAWQPACDRVASAVQEDVFAGCGCKHGDDRWDEARQAAHAAWAAERRAHCDILRDLFGDLLGPPGEEGRWLPCWLASGPWPRPGPEQWCLLPTLRRHILRPEWLAWNGGTVRRLAQAIYEEEAFDRLPILADALEDAGCTDADLIAHLRAPGPHWRGCHVLDLIAFSSP